MNIRRTRKHGVAQHKIKHDSKYKICESEHCTHTTGVKSKRELDTDPFILDTEMVTGSDDTDLAADRSDTDQVVGFI
jgi:hypothetical protein